MTHATEVALPAGADIESDDWYTDEGVTQRLVWSRPMPLPEHLATNDIRVVVLQHADGTIVNAKGDDEPLVYHGCSDYTIDDARTIAQALLAAADLADNWVGQSETKALERIAKTAAQVCLELRNSTHTEAAEYMLSAMVSVLDAIEELR